MKKSTLLLAVPVAMLVTAFTLESTPPPTLLDLSHASWPPARLEKAVLVIIDAQREYTDGTLRLAGVDAAIDETAALLARARAAHTPVIHVVQYSAPGRGVFDRTGPMVGIVAPLTPLPRELVVTKALPNAFAGTRLVDELARIGRRDVILAGFMTHMCISATARAALDEGYRATVVASACATRDLPDGAGGTVSAADVQRIELAALRDRFACVVATASDIAD